MSSSSLLPKSSLVVSKVSPLTFAKSLLNASTLSFISSSVMVLLWDLLYVIPHLSFPLVKVIMIVLSFWRCETCHSHDCSLLYICCKSVCYGDLILAHLVNILRSSFMELVIHGAGCLSMILAITGATWYTREYNK